MASRTRRRSPKVVWLPQTDANSIGALKITTWNEVVLDLAGAKGNFVTGFSPIVIDEPADPFDLHTTLADVEESGYRLRRIVGKIFATTKSQATQGPIVTSLTAGFCIMRVDPGNPGAPIQATANLNQMNPELIDNTDNPWIWRRSWFLRNGLATSGDINQWASWPSNNVSPGGSSFDGPHIDQKTARIVGKDERLFLILGQTVIEPGTDDQVAANTNVYWDLRILASIRNNTGNRRNASR